MKKLILFSSLTMMLIVSCSNGDYEIIEEEKVYTTVGGNIYVAKSPASWETSTFYIYKMSKDSTIVIEKRLNSDTGILKDSMKGYYKYEHPKLELKVQSISQCEKCFNYFTATVEDDRKSFKYTIWDMGISKNQIIEFKIKSIN